MEEIKTLMSNKYVYSEESSSAVEKDISLNFDSVVSCDDIRYVDFRRKLKPKYSVVWFHIACAYVAFAAIAMLLITLLSSSSSALYSVAIAAFGGILFGYTLAYLQLFLHEAAHYNLAKAKKLNDTLTNLFVGLMVGLEIGTYRRVHSEHHRVFGTVNDTERTYFAPLNLGFIIESLTGMKVLRVLITRSSALSKGQSGDRPERKQASTKSKVLLVCGLLFNLAIVAASVVSGFWAIALAWVIGMFAMFPFFASLRQVLEHRDEDANAAIDYSITNHGAVNRLFGDGPIASTFGGAGFSRHLIHHWDPQISYTRLKEVEQFLAKTNVEAILQARCTTYIKAFLQLFSR